MGDTTKKTAADLSRLASGGSSFTDQNTAIRGTPFPDLPSDQPTLGYTELGSYFAERLRSVAPASYVLGLFGGYGSGKTTLMRAIAKALRSGKQDASVIWFEAWRYDHEEYLFLPFLATLSRQLTTQEHPMADAPQIVQNAFRSFLYGLSLKLGPVGWSVATSRDQEAKLNQTDTDRLSSGFDDIPELLRKLTAKKPIIVLVDDLDRCVPGKAFAFIEAMKSFACMNGWLWVFGLDPRVITSQSRMKFDESFAIDPKEYLEKIVTESFALPGLKMPDTLESFRHMLYGAGSTVSAQQSAADLVDALWELREHLPANVRQVKRILNIAQTVFATQSVVSRDTDIELVLGVLVLLVRWPAIGHCVSVIGFHSFMENWPHKDTKCLEKRCHASSAILGMFVSELREHDKAGELLKLLDDCSKPGQISEILKLLPRGIDMHGGRCT